MCAQAAFLVRQMQSQGENMQLGSYARGSIEPQPRIVAGEITEQEVAQFVQELDGADFYDEIESFMPKCCVDGRHRADGTCQLGANAAGGVFTLLAADMLSTQTLRRNARDTAEYAASLCHYLHSTQGGQFGDHIAEEVQDKDDSGCGAIDKMATAVTLIAHEGGRLRELAAAIGLIINDADFEIITGRARAIVDEHSLTVATGKEMISKLTEAAGEASAEVLTGVHNEVAVVINERGHTTLNRAKIKARYGDRLQAFNYDRWAMRQAVRTLGPDMQEDEARLKLTAADMYNLAVTCTLAGPSLYGVARAV
jgi:hypothetical protein